MKELVLERISAEYEHLMVICDSIISALNLKKEDAKDIKIELDYILQGILLHIAIIDNNFSKGEKLVIKDLVRNADILKFINKKYHTNYNWNYFEQLDSFEEMLTQVIDDTIIENTKLFAKKCKIIDDENIKLSININVNLVSHISDTIKNLAIAFANADDEALNKEIDVANKTIKELFINNWKNE